MNGEMLIQKIFAPGSRIMLEYVDSGGTVKNCSTQVEDLEGQYIVLQAPVENDATVSFRESQELTLRRLDDQKKEAYVTNVFVIDVRQGKMPLLVCSKPYKIDKTSLRRFSRFGVDLVLDFTFQDKVGSGHINDLSLTGCYILADDASMMSEGTLLELSLTIPGEALLQVSGKVIRVDKIAASGKVGLAVDYVQISEVEQEIIYNYIFQLQLTSDGILDTRPDKGH